ncbi:amidohydrolase [candidate division KSB1 bacterium]|nr:amidohydrolase [candidate division KSB1 bacterium]
MFFSHNNPLRISSIILLLVSAIFLLLFNACSRQNADLILLNGRVYSYAWDDPAPDGTPAANAPYKDGAWHPDAEAVAVRGNRLIFVGSNKDVEAYRSESTRVIDVHGGTVIPGLVDSHTHVEGLGRNLERVNLTSAKNEEEAVALVAAHAANVPKGEWIVGWGWDEGAWANHYPDMKLLSERIPDHPVVMSGLHGFAAWGNRLALEKADITAETPPPAAGEIVRDKAGNPTGLFMNNATGLLSAAIPEPSHEQRKRWVLAGLEEMAKSGYVAVHEAGVGTPLMQALESLEAKGKLPIRVYAMISARDEELMRARRERGPDRSNDKMLITRAVKAYYDGALGSRGARLLDDYSDKPGHRGLSGENYGFDQALAAEMIHAGFQVGIHAIGDAGNRETLEFFEKVIAADPRAKTLRHRIEHAQVIHPDDFPRFKNSEIIASMQPPHAVEDKTWAEDRLGPERIKGAYAWRTLRKSGARLVFNSDLAGSDHNIFYGLHSAITRRGKDLQPPTGWHIEEAVTSEEALRAYTVWPAYAAFLENETGVLAPGKWADLTVLSIDPHNLGMTDAHKLFEGSVLLTVVGGNIVHQQSR